MNYLSIVGTRPQLIKASVLSAAFSSLLERESRHYVIDTSQHYDDSLSDAFKQQLFSVQERELITTLLLNFDSEIEFIASCISALEPLVKEIDPSVILSYGDTNSTICACIVANRLKIPLAHIEAGVRDRGHFRPEEMNRLIADTMSDLLFAPTTDALKNVETEFSGSQSKKIVFSGDVMRDLHVKYAGGFNAPKLGFTIKNNFVLATLHRQENVDIQHHLENIICALNSLSEEIQVILPMHPRTMKMIKRFRLDVAFDICDPQDYLSFQWLIQRSLYVITDSGGLQKDASFAGKRSLVIYRGHTGWSELVQNGFLELIDPADPGLVEKMLSFDSSAPIKMEILDRVFGAGDAGEKIAKTVISYTN